MSRPDSTTNHATAFLSFFAGRRPAQRRSAAARINDPSVRPPFLPSREAIAFTEPLQVSCRCTTAITSWALLRTIAQCDGFRSGLGPMRIPLPQDEETPR
jgi:hypothetical protein